jgi:NADH:ubiquinone oxidoreductase subunit 6 (subunit J)
MTSVLFWLFALAACGGALAVVIEKNVVRMAFWLIVALGSVAGLFFLLGADFVGATQLLIYVGGTIVLLIFGVMLTATGPLSRTMTISRGEQVLAGVIGVSLLCVIGVSALAVSWDDGRGTRGEGRYADGGTTRPLGLKLLGLDNDKLSAEIESERRASGAASAPRENRRSEDRSQGSASLNAQRSTLSSTGYLLPFEIASVHLLVVLIGAAYLARAKRRATS